jgi:hypothetical protein
VRKRVVEGRGKESSANCAVVRVAYNLRTGMVRSKTVKISLKNHVPTTQLDDFGLPSEIDPSSPSSARQTYSQISEITLDAE